MSIERTIDLHEAKIDSLGSSIKNLELETAIVVENLNSIKEAIKSIQECLLGVKETQITHGSLLTTLTHVEEKVSDLKSFQLDVTKRFHEEEIKRNQIRGWAKFIKNNWGVFLAIIGIGGIIFGALDAAYNMPSPSQADEIKALLKQVSKKL